MPALQTQPRPATTPGLADARSLLSRVWGHGDFRGLQSQVVAEILAGRSEEHTSELQSH